MLFFELGSAYLPFEGICLVDTFEIAEDQQTSHLDILFSKENTARVKKQKEAPIFVVIGNPPYNAGQLNENDNNKNRKYPVMDKRVADTYSRDSKASNKNALSDVYVKAFRFAADRIKCTGEGIVAFVSNNSFIDDYPFDGMRRSLKEEFDSIYIIDLGGNVRKNPKLSGTTHNIFGIQVGVSINILVKRRSKETTGDCQIFYCRLDEYWKKEQKFQFLDDTQNFQAINWQEIRPDKNDLWLTSEMDKDFEYLMQIGSKEVKAGFGNNVIFETFSNGVQTNRDTWAYNFSAHQLEINIKRFINTYNAEIDRWNKREKSDTNIDSFVISEEKLIKWCSKLKELLQRNERAKWDIRKVRKSLYRPFCLQYLFFDNALNHRQGQFPVILPAVKNENENLIICITNHTQIPFLLQMSKYIPSQDVGGRAGQCFPFYTYSESGTNRRENITDWSLAEFRSHYSDNKITKWDIFYYIYAILHHPLYRSKYAANLRRSLPRIPYAPDFRGFANAGKRLADLHVNYEEQKEYKLEFIENPKSRLDWRVEKMRLSKDKTQVVYNDFLTLAGIPAEAFEYRLGNRSALDWIIDQYQVSTDKRSGIVNDPNNPDDPEYIVKLIGKVIRVSLETVKIVKGLPELEE